MQLRYYQNDAVDALWENLNRHVVASLPTGAGKSIIIAELCRRACQEYPGTRVLVIAHVQELVQQNAQKIIAHWPLAPVGIYSAGLRRYQVDDITVASIQSIYRRPKDLRTFDIIIVDEAHRIPHKAIGMYHAVFAANPEAKIAGLTATPYRMNGGLLTEGDDALFDDIVIEVSTARLIREKFLAPIRARRTAAAADLSKVHVRGGEFIAGELATAFDDAALTASAISDVLTHAGDRKSIMVFACSVAHCQYIADKLHAAGQTSTCIVTGDTPDEQRRAAVNQFKAGRVRFLINCDVLTTGFDAPNVDCIVLLRATKSPGLYVQIVGRGLRTAPGKTDCLLLDYGENIERHGPLDDITAERSRAGKLPPPMKTCPTCQDIIPAACRTCPGCGYQFPAPERDESTTLAHGTTASTLDPLTAVRRYLVSAVRYGLHEKPGKPHSLRVTYTLRPETETAPPSAFAQAVGIKYISEWICPLHDGFAKSKAIRWLARRGVTSTPTSINDLLDLAPNLPKPAAVVVREGKFPEILAHEFP